MGDGLRFGLTIFTFFFAVTAFILASGNRLRQRELEEWLKLQVTQVEGTVENLRLMDEQAKKFLNEAILLLRAGGEILPSPAVVEAYKTRARDLVERHQRWTYSLLPPELRAELEEMQSHPLN